MPPVMRMACGLGHRPTLLLVACFASSALASDAAGNPDRVGSHVMVRELRVGLWALLAAGVLLAARPARAEERTPAPVFVLTLMTDDADDQADALTRALRARVEMLSAWSLEETTQSFETLSIALRCPTTPDTPCLERIGDQLHADHYVWGTMTRARGEVTADVNLWNRGGAGAHATATFPDNLKDIESPKLRTVAVRLLESLLGSPEPPQPVHGKPEQDAVPGPGPTPPAPEPAASESTPPSSGPNRLPKALGYAGLAAGAVLLAASALEVVKWSNDTSLANQQRAMVPSSVSDVCAAQSLPAAALACQTSTRVTNDAIFAWAFGLAGAAVAGTGAWLLITSSSSGDAKPAAWHPPLEVVPTIGSRVRSLDIKFTF